MTEKFAFLTSVRFWKLGAMGIVTGLAFALPENVWVKALAVAIDVWFGGSVAVKTADRAGDKKVEAAEISNDTLIP